MRIRFEEYRRWNIEQWCGHVRSLNVSTLSQWAFKARGSYNIAVTLGYQRQFARNLGWLPKLEPGEMQRLSDDDFAERFRAMGAKSVTDMWKGAQHYCEFLRQASRLERVAALLGFGYVTEWRPNELEYYLERCRRVGDFTVWSLLDKNAVISARKFGLLAEVRKLAPKRPAKGYPTRGGPCQSLPELAVARLLEANGIEFLTQMAYPFTFPRGYRHPCRGDFYLTSGAPTLKCGPPHSMILNCSGNNIWCGAGSNRKCAHV